MQADHCWVAFFAAASFSTSLAMSLLSVRMPASGPLLVASVNSWLIVLHLPIAVCSAWGRSAGLAAGLASIPRVLSAEPAGARKPYCCAAVMPRYPQAPQGCANDRFAGPRLTANGTFRRARIARRVQARLGEGVARLVGR